ncbi:MAG TPA: hypothetical protein VK611_20795 [Acidimicrobiales bacterium]|nr:hypothetical protein [Acidimicrobiales bacterium]
MTTSYKVFLFLHILSVVVAFAPASVHPLLQRQFGSDSPQLLQRFAGFASQNGRRVYAPALLLAGLWGILIIVTQEGDYFAFDQTWVNLALVVWIAMNGVVHGIIVPSERKLGAGDAEAEKRLDLGGMIITVLFLIMLYLMIWKPGL